MKTILGALEAMDEVVDNDAPVEDGELAETMLAVMEAETETSDATKELEETDDVMAEVDSSIERLEAIKAAIEKFGICEPMMRAVDPNSELVAAGIIKVAYEELENTPVKDENAEAAVEGFVDTLKSIWKKIVEFFKMIGNKIMSWINAIMGSFKSYEAALVAVAKKLKEANIDETKFKDYDVKAYSHEDFDKLAKAIEPMLKDLSSSTIVGLNSKINEDVNKTKTSYATGNVSTFNSHIEKYKDSEILGIKIERYTEGDDKDKVKKVVVKKSNVSTKKANIKELGYTSVSQIEGHIKVALQLITNAKGADRSGKFLAKEYEIASKNVNKQVAEITSGMSTEEGKARNTAVTAAKDALSTTRTILGVGMKLNGALYGSIYRVASAALRAKGSK
jgi:hypothetical protein